MTGSHPDNFEDDLPASGEDLRREAFELTIRLWAGLIEPSAVLTWAEAKVGTTVGNDQSLLLQLFAGDSTLPMETILKEIVGNHSERLAGTEGARALASVVAREAEKLLAGEIKPLEFCGVVVFFDANLSQSTAPRVWAWVRKLWNACDWCDETWDLENSPWLVSAVQEFLATEVSCSRRGCRLP